MMKTKIKPNIRELTIDRGISYPTDTELLMMILGSGTKQTPVEELAGKVSDLILSCDYEKLLTRLLKINGMGKSKALSIMAALELGKRSSRSQNVKIKHPQDVLPYVLQYSTKKQEHFISIYLNGAHEILQVKVNSIGTATQAIITPRDLFFDAIKGDASSMVICHNHPSGKCNPSEHDIKTTSQLIEGAKLLGIDLLDHVIFSAKDYFSFRENNLLFTDC